MSKKTSKNKNKSTSNKGVAKKKASNGAKKTSMNTNATNTPIETNLSAYVSDKPNPVEMLETVKKIISKTEEVIHVQRPDGWTPEPLPTRKRRANGETKLKKESTRIKIYGHSVCAVLRALGKAGVKVNDVKAIMKAKNVKASDATIAVHVYQGSAGTKDKAVANLSEKEIDELKSLVSEEVSEKAS